MKIKQYTTFIVSGLALILILLFPAIKKYWQKAGVENKAIESFKVVCDLEKECSLVLPERQVVLDIEPDSLPVMKPLDISITLNGIDAERVSMQFQGRDMAMNLAPFQLFSDEEQGSRQHFEGTGYISYCTITQDMVWLARLEIESEQSLITVTFELKG
ncbi:hypothetical protein EOPP23_12265 [Endozoicomonas sp. OPT23]|uniref:hypothetical protein n=1 Tax=Endozoicomonas sp. OPT23 TaxID=2072845 RepID=UPI00129A5778|nr:hypothetical protein [Endozoicomonas sp. OPT23]MRI33762.1 hypothetical protein [Endozoicomonas sp. OPT23]